MQDLSVRLTNHVNFLFESEDIDKIVPIYASENKELRKYIEKLSKNNSFSARLKQRGLKVSTKRNLFQKLTEDYDYWIIAERCYLEEIQEIDFDCILSFAEKGDLPRVAFIVNNLIYSDEDLDLFVIRAASYGHGNIVLYILKKFGKSKRSLFSSALRGAARLGDKKLVEEILEISTKRFVLSDLFAVAEGASEGGHLELLKEYVERMKKMRTFSRIRLNSLLDLAIEADQVEIIAYFVSQEAEVNNIFKAKSLEALSYLLPFANSEVLVEDFSEIQDKDSLQDFFDTYEYSGEDPRFFVLKKAMEKGDFSIVDALEPTERELLQIAIQLKDMNGIRSYKGFLDLDLLFQYRIPRSFSNSMNQEFLFQNQR